MLVWPFLAALFSVFGRLAGSDESQQRADAQRTVRRNVLLEPHRPHPLVFPAGLRLNRSMNNFSRRSLCGLARAQSPWSARPQAQRSACWAREDRFGAVEGSAWQPSASSSRISSVSIALYSAQSVLHALPLAPRRVQLAGRAESEVRDAASSLGGQHTRA